MRNCQIIFAGLLLALLCSCGGGGRAQRSSTGDSPQDPPAGLGKAVSLSLRSAAPSGNVLDLSVMASGAAELHQMSLRLAYDPRAVRPLGAERGPLIDERAVFFAAPDKPAARAAAYVPIAFTYHLGERIPAGSGELLSLQFEVLDAGRDPGISVIRSADFLIARDTSGANMQVLSGGGDE